MYHVYTPINAKKKTDLGKQKDAFFKASFEIIADKKTSVL